MKQEKEMNHKPVWNPIRPQTPHADRVKKNEKSREREGNAQEKDKSLPIKILRYEERNQITREIEISPTLKIPKTRSLKNTK